MSFTIGSKVYKILCTAVNNVPTITGPQLKNKLVIYDNANGTNPVLAKLCENNTYKVIAEHYNKLKSGDAKKAIVPEAPPEDDEIDNDNHEEEIGEPVDEINEEEDDEPEPIPKKIKPVVPLLAKKAVGLRNTNGSRRVQRTPKPQLSADVETNAPTTATPIKITDDGIFEQFLQFCNTHFLKEKGAKPLNKKEFKVMYDKFISAYSLYKGTIATITKYCDDNDITADFKSSTQTFTYKLRTNMNKKITPVPFKKVWEPLYANISAYYKLCKEMNDRYKMIDMGIDILLEYLGLAIWYSNNLYALDSYDIPFFKMNFVHVVGKERKEDICTNGKYDTMLIYANPRNTKNVFTHRYGILSGNPALTNDVLREKYNACLDSMEEVSDINEDVHNVLKQIIESDTYYSVIMKCCASNAKYIQPTLWRLFAKLDRIAIYLYPISFIFSSYMLGGEYLQKNKSKNMYCSYLDEIMCKNTKLFDNLEEAWCGLLDEPMNTNQWMIEYTSKHGKSADNDDVDNEDEE